MTAEAADTGETMPRLFVRVLTPVSETLSSVLVFGWILALLTLIDLILAVTGRGGN